MLRHDKPRIKGHDLVARVHQDRQSKQQPTAGSTRDKRLPVRVAEFCRHARLQRITKWRNPLCDRIDIFTRFDGRNQRLFDTRRSIVVGLPDTQIYRVLHSRREVEHLADSRGIDLMHPVGNPGF